MENNIQKRAEYLYHVAHVFRQDSERLAKVMTHEMGRPIIEARSFHTVWNSVRNFCGMCGRSV